MGLPPLTGTYQRYKANTTILTTWLTHTATACGYQLPAPRNHTSQPPAAGEHGETRYAVLVSELPRLALAIAQSGHVGLLLPRSIQRIAERAIEGRLVFASVVKGVRQDAAADATHQHCIHSQPQDELFSAIRSINKTPKYMNPHKPRGGGPYWAAPDVNCLDVFKVFTFIEKSQIDGFYVTGTVSKILEEEKDILFFKNHPDTKANVVFDLPPNSRNSLFVHPVQQSLWEDKKREVCEPELRKQDKWPISTKSDLEKAAGSVNKWPKRERLLRG